MKNIVYIIICNLILIGCSENTSFENPNYNGEKNTGYGKVLFNNYTASLESGEFVASKVRVFESEELLNSSLLVLRGELEGERITISFDEEPKLDSIYKLEDYTTPLDIVYVEEALSTSPNYNKVQSGEIEIFDFDLDKGIVNFNYSGKFNDESEVTSGKVDVRYIPNFFTAKTPDGVDFINSNVSVLKADLNGESVLSIGAFGDNLEGKTKNSISMAIHGDIERKQYNFSPTDVNIATYATYNPIKSEIATAGSITIMNYSEEDGFVNGTFSYKVPSGNVTGSFSLTFITFDFDALYDAIND